MASAPATQSQREPLDRFICIFLIAKASAAATRPKSTSPFHEMVRVFRRSTALYGFQMSVPIRTDPETDRIECCCRSARPTHIAGLMRLAGLSRSDSTHDKAWPGPDQSGPSIRSRLGVGIWLGTGGPSRISPSDERSARYRAAAFRLDRHQYRRRCRTQPDLAEAPRSERSNRAHDPMECATPHSLGCLCGRRCLRPHAKRPHSASLRPRASAKKGDPAQPVQSRTEP